MEPTVNSRAFLDGVFSLRLISVVINPDYALGKSGLNWVIISNA